METFTRDEVVNMLVSVIMFSNANNGQGTGKIKGGTFGEKAHHVINVHNAIKDTPKSMISAVGMLDKPIPSVHERSEELVHQE